MGFDIDQDAEVSELIARAMDLSDHMTLTLHGPLLQRKVSALEEAVGRYRAAGYGDPRDQQ